jgi:uncharacterized protein (TIGR02271 family)
MTTATRAATPITAGWNVYGSDDEKLGTVAEVGGNYLVVEKGLVFVKDVYVPTNAVERIDETDQAVWLNVPKDEVESMGWDHAPSGGSWNTWTPSGSAGHDRQRMTLHEEELDARKTAHKAGEVEVRKDVVQEHRTMDVPVTREEVHVRQVPADRPASHAEASFKEGETIRVPVTEEEVEVTKRPRVTGEVEVEKVARPGTERAAATVRKETADVSREGVTRSS